MKELDVSFVIPAWNEQETLKYTVANLYQTVKGYSFEIIVVDDHSDEPLSEFILPNHEVIYIRNHERLGVSKSRNIGASHAMGKILIFLDAHVCFSENWIGEIFKEEKLLDEAIIGMAFYLLYDFRRFKDRALDLRTPKIDVKNIIYGASITPLPAPRFVRNYLKKSDTCFQIPTLGAGALAVKRSLFFDLGCFENELTGYGSFEDDEFSMRCWVFGYRVLVMPSVVCYHYCEPSHSKGGGVDYQAKPFAVARDDHSAENALRVFYLHLSQERFDLLLGVYKNHPGFKPDLDAIITEKLRERRDVINRRRVHDDLWLLERLSKIGDEQVRMTS